MRQRVLERFAFEHVRQAELALLEGTLSAALALRCTRLGEHDPRLLHPARTVLILLDDARVTDAVVLAAAALVESEDGALGVGAGERAGLPIEVTALAAAVPLPGGAAEQLLEALVVAPRDVRLIACAERLDQARHAHMVGAMDTGAWLRQVHQIYLPVAARTEPLLARRFERWAGARARGLERP